MDSSSFLSSRLVKEILIDFILKQEAMDAIEVT